MIGVFKSTANALREPRWHFSRQSDLTGSLLQNSVDAEADNGGGYATLAELLDEIKTRWPDEQIVGIGVDEPEAEGLSW
jgi:hypothetical protein